MIYELDDSEGEALPPSAQGLLDALQGHAENLSLQQAYRINKACEQMMQERRETGRMRGVLVRADRSVVLSEDVPYGMIRYEQTGL